MGVTRKRLIVKRHTKRQNKKEVEKLTGLIIKANYYYPNYYAFDGNGRRRQPLPTKA